MVNVYDEEPGTIDSGVLSPSSDMVDVEAAIKEAYTMMKSRVHAEDSPLLLADCEVWEALRQQWDEFAGFYRSARGAVTIFKKVLEASSRFTDEVPCGDLEKVSRDEHALEKERYACIDAVTNFYGKFSAILNEL